MNFLPFQLLKRYVVIFFLRLKHFLTSKEDKEFYELVTYLKNNVPSYVDPQVIDNYVKEQNNRASYQNQAQQV